MCQQTHQCQHLQDIKQKVRQLIIMVTKTGTRINFKTNEKPYLKNQENYFVPEKKMQQQRKEKYQGVFCF